MSAGLLLWLASLCGAAVPLDSQPMPRVEIPRYLGRWYEIARYPQWFERDCHAVTADYSLNPDGSIAVLNTCRRGSVSGPVKTAKAKAWPIHPGNSRLKVRFFWPFRGDYWIVLLDPEYRWAVVGHPRRSSLWILSRTPSLAAGVEAEILRQVAALGYDTARLERGGQPPEG